MSQPDAPEPAQTQATPPAPDSRPTTPPQGKVVPSTRISAAWIGVVIGLVLLIALLIFIFQNLDNVRVTFVAFHGSFPLALCLLGSAIAGAVIVLAIGTARIIQLRRAARRQRDAAASGRSGTS